jgi:hypothetical protein
MALEANQLFRFTNLAYKVWHDVIGVLTCVTDICPIGSAEDILLLQQ